MKTEVLIRGGLECAHTEDKSDAPPDQTKTRKCEEVHHNKIK